MDLGVRADDHYLLTHDPYQHEEAMQARALVRARCHESCGMGHDANSVKSCRSASRSFFFRYTNNMGQTLRR